MQGGKEEVVGIEGKRGEEQRRRRKRIYGRRGKEKKMRMRGKRWTEDGRGCTKEERGTC